MRITNFLTFIFLFLSFSSFRAETLKNIPSPYPGSSPSLETTEVGSEEILWEEEESYVPESSGRSYFPFGLGLYSRKSTFNLQTNPKYFQFNFLYGASRDLYGLNSGLGITQFQRGMRKDRTIKVSEILGGDLNLLLSYGGNQRGLSFSGFSTFRDRYSLGIQIAGFSNTVGERKQTTLPLPEGQVAEIHPNDPVLYGLNLAGVVNGSTVIGGVSISSLNIAHMGSLTGVNLGLIMNWSHSGRVRGLNLAGLINAAGILEGVNLSGLVNAGDEMNGIQLSAISNIGKTINGINLAGIMNSSNDSSGLSLGGLANLSRNHRGMSVSFWNRISGVLTGVSVGVINQSESTEGLQMGLINLSQKKSRLQIGLINYSKDNWIPFFPFLNFDFGEM